MQREVLVVGRDDASTGAICDALRTAGRSVVRTGDRMSACERIALLPTIAALVIDAEVEGVAAAADLARFARRVVPDLLVFYLTAEAVGVASPSDPAGAGVVVDKALAVERLRSAFGAAGWA